MGLAAHHYHADRHHLPPGYLGPSIANNANLPAFFNEGQWVGHLPMLLPYLEQDAVYREVKINFNVGVVTPEKWFWSAPAPGPGPPNVPNYLAAMQPLRIFRCPSAYDIVPSIGNPDIGGGGTILGLHVYNSTSRPVFTVGWKDEYGSANSFRPLGRTNYVGVVGCGSGNHPIFGKYEGIYINRIERTLGQITTRDGTSNTLLYGETCGSSWNSPPETMNICWMGGGSLGTYLGLRRGRDAPLIAFSSYHPGGINFCFADGSVRTIRFGQTGWDGTPKSPLSNDWYVLQRLAGWRDGEAAEAGSLID
jgi:prepilin-type processing-associated H-X9-DG protein